MNTRRINVGDMQGRLSEESLEATQETCKSLLASRGFWIGGALSVLCYIAIVWSLS